MNPQQLHNTFSSIPTQRERAPERVTPLAQPVSSVRNKKTTMRQSADNELLWIFNRRAIDIQSGKRNTLKVLIAQAAKDCEIGATNLKTLGGKRSTMVPLPPKEDVLSCKKGSASASNTETCSEPEKEKPKLSRKVSFFSCSETSNATVGSPHASSQHIIAPQQSRTPNPGRARETGENGESVPGKVTRKDESTQNEDLQLPASSLPDLIEQREAKENLNVQDGLERSAPSMVSSQNSSHLSLVDWILQVRGEHLLNSDELNLTDPLFTRKSPTPSTPAPEKDASESTPPNPTYAQVFVDEPEGDSDDSSHSDSELDIDSDSDIDSDIDSYATARTHQPVENHFTRLDAHNVPRSQNPAGSNQSSSFADRAFSQSLKADTERNTLATIFEESEEDVKDEVLTDAFVDSGNDTQSMKSLYRGDERNNKANIRAANNGKTHSLDRPPVASSLSLHVGMKLPNLKEAGNNEEGKNNREQKNQSRHEAPPAGKHGSSSRLVSPSDSGDASVVFSKAAPGAGSRIVAQRKEFLKDMLEDKDTLPIEVFEFSDIDTSDHEETWLTRSKAFSQTNEQKAAQGKKSVVRKDVSQVASRPDMPKAQMQAFADNRLARPVSPLTEIKKDLLSTVTEVTKQLQELHTDAHSVLFSQGIAEAKLLAKAIKAIENMLELSQTTTEFLKKAQTRQDLEKAVKTISGLQSAVHDKRQQVAETEHGGAEDPQQRRMMTVQEESEEESTTQVPQPAPAREHSALETYFLDIGEWEPPPLSR